MAQSRYAAIPNASHVGTEVALVAATVKTILQVATPATQDITVVSYWVSFDGITAAAEPAQVMLIDTNVAATVTSLTPVQYSDPNAPASLCVGGAALTGFNASAEGTITASRLLDYQEVHPQGGGLVMQFPLGREPGVGISRFLRLRVNAPAAVNAACGIIWEE